MKREFLKYIIVFVSLIVVFFAFSVVACMLPNYRIKKNIEKSLPSLLEQGNYPTVVINTPGYRLDNFTDALFLSQNYKIDRNKPVNSAMLCSIASWSANRAETLEAQIDNKVTQYMDYPRYWHGNTFFLRLLLVFLNYNDIRLLLYLISNILLIVLCVKLFQNVGMIKMLAFASGLFFVNIFITHFSMQLFTAVNLAIIASILICSFYKKKKKNIPVVFFVIACLTSYFDLLTTPLLTLGLPLIVFFMIDDENSVKEIFKKLISYSGLWLLGFACCWASKWVISTLLTDINVFYEAYRNIVHRAGSGEFSRFSAITRNFDLLPLKYIKYVFFSLLIFAACFFDKKGLKKAIPFFLIAILPYVWLFVLANHSYAHFWFTYRIQAISIISVFMVLINLISWDKINIVLKKMKAKFIPLKVS